MHLSPLSPVARKAQPQGVVMLRKPREGGRERRRGKPAAGTSSTA